MEELRSTEILDKEIYDDANRKADRILKNASMECEKILFTVSEKIEENRNQKNIFYSKKIDDYKKDIVASIPLEKERLLVFFVDDAINQAMTRYLSSLSKENKIEIIKNKIIDYKESLKSSNIDVVISGFSKKDIQPIIEEVLGKKVINSISEKADDSFTGCIITTQDNSTRCRASIEEKVQEIVDTYRNELSEALFAGEIRL